VVVLVLRVMMKEKTPALIAEMAVVVVGVVVHEEKSFFEEQLSIVDMPREKEEVDDTHLCYFI